LSDRVRFDGFAWGAGASLLALHVFLRVLSVRFPYETGGALRPIRLLVCLLVVSGLVYLFGLLLLHRRRPGKGRLTAIVLMGVLMRWVYAGSQPMLEVDFYRYLWDGGVVARGFNPYAYRPKDIVDGHAGSAAAPAGLVGLGKDSSPLVRRVHYPHIRTVYPPVAQAAFALAYWIHPWGLDAWRLVVFGLDVATLALLWRLLARAKAPLFMVAVYWWNPIVVKEFYNPAHMDIVALPFAVGAVLLASDRKYLRSAAALAVGVGAKIWPVLLLPILLRPLLRRPLRLLAAVLVFGVLLTVIYLPVAESEFLIRPRLSSAGTEARPDSGFLAYGQRWEMNDALFMLLLWQTKFLVEKLELVAVNAGVLARCLVAVILGLVVLALSWKPWTDADGLCERCLWAVAAAFLLSPTQFPWYFIWFVPFLAVRPWVSLLLLTALLPVYYLRFYFAHVLDNVALFDHWVVWIEFVPVWIVLGVEVVVRCRVSGVRCQSCLPLWRDCP